MVTYILTFHNSSLYSRPTGMKLAEVAGFTPIRNFESNIDPGSDLIRYGIDSYPSSDLLFEVVLNKSDDIKRSKNKLISSRYLLTHGINTPRIWINKRNITREDLPVLRRLKYHSRGIDIIYIDTLNRLRRVTGDYYVKYIPSILEYRLHIINGVPVRLQKKIPLEEEHIIHNVDHGYILADHYHHNIDIEKRVIEEGIKAIKVMNLDFGALDILVGEDGTPYILEINSAPRLSKYGRQLYGYYFNKLLGKDVNLEDYPRLRWNEGRYYNGLEEIEFRQIVKRDQRSYYE